MMTRDALPTVKSLVDEVAQRLKSVGWFDKADEVIIQAGYRALHLLSDQTLEVAASFHDLGLHCETHGQLKAAAMCFSVAVRIRMNKLNVMDELTIRSANRLNAVIAKAHQEGLLGE
jgi:hypothetical protein